MIVVSEPFSLASSKMATWNSTQSEKKLDFRSKQIYWPEDIFSRGKSNKSHWRKSFFFSSFFNYIVVSIVI